MRKSLAILTLIVGALSSPAPADIGLAQRCDSATVATQAAACTGLRTWMHPTVNDAGFYLSYTSSPADSTTVSWSDPALQFRPYQSILSSNPGTYGVMVCTKDLPVPSVIAVTDTCAPGNDKVAKVFVASSSVMLAAVATPAPTTVKGTVPLGWSAPTADTGGAALTDLTGFNVYRGLSCSALVKVASTPTVTYTDSGLTVGTYCYAVTAVSASEGESAQSLTLTVAFTPPAPLGRPNPPGAPTAQCTIVAPPGMKASCSVTP